MEEWLEAVSEGTTDVVLGRWVADYPDADTFASILASKEGCLVRCVVWRKWIA